MKHYLADVARPRRFLLSGWSHQDDRVRLDIFGLHHHFEVQVLRVLAAPLPFGCKAQIQQTVIL